MRYLLAACLVGLLAWIVLAQPRIQKARIKPIPLIPVPTATPFKADFFLHLPKQESAPTVPSYPAQTAKKVSD